VPFGSQVSNPGLGRAIGAEAFGEQYANLQDLYDFGITPKGIRFAMDNSTNNPQLNRLKEIVLEGKISPHATINRNTGGVNIHPEGSKWNASITPGLFGGDTTYEVNYDSNRGLTPMQPGSSPEDAVTKALLEYKYPYLKEKGVGGAAAELDIAQLFGDRSEPIRTTGGGGRKGFLGLGGRYPTWEHAYDTDTGISTIDTEGYGTRRYRTVTDPDGYVREEMLPITWKK